MTIDEDSSVRVPREPYGYDTQRYAEGWECLFTGKDDDAVEGYCSKYSLSWWRYFFLWQWTADRVFDTYAMKLWRLNFQPGFEGIAMFNRGTVLTRQTFLALQRCMRALGETRFAIFEDTRDGLGDMPTPSFRMVYPVDITYEELWRDDLGSLGEDMQTVFGQRNDIRKNIFQSTTREFRTIRGHLVLSEKGAWGIYAATDLCGERQRTHTHPALYPVSFIGFKPKYTEVFVREWGNMISNVERDMLRSMLPEHQGNHFLKHLPKVTTHTLACNGAFHKPFA